MGLPRRVLLRALLLVARVLQAAASFFSYLAAGTFGRADIGRSLVAEWDDFARSPDRVRYGLHPWEREFYGRFLRKGDRILLVGCGTGRDLLPLLEDGYETEGIDLAPNAVGTCAENVKARGLTAALHVGPIETATFDVVFDTVVFSWWCYAYLPGRAARAQALANVRRHLSPRGQVLLSYVSWSEGARRPPLWLTRVSCALLRTGWRPESGDAIWLQGGWRRPYLHFEHRFTADEIEREARDAGLQVACHEQGAEARLALTLPPGSVGNEGWRSQRDSSSTVRTADASGTKDSS
jgi:SAM-dependent methyltransferase